MLILKLNLSLGIILLNDTSMLKRTNIPSSTGFIHILTHSLVVNEQYASSNIMMLNRSKSFDVLKLI